MESGGESHVAAIGKRCDNQTTRVTQILIPILELSVCLPNHAIINLLQETTQRGFIRRQITQGYYNHVIRHWR